MFTAILATSPWWGSVTLAAIEAVGSAILAYDVITILSR